VALGLPVQQLGSIHANTLMRGGASAADGFARRELPPEIVGFATVVGRQIDGIAIAESIAWAEFDGNGKVAAETLYWPDIPLKAVEEARAFVQTMNNPTSATTYRALLPAGISATGQVVIHHAPHWAEGPAWTQVSYDSPSTTKGTTMRHFGTNGSELRLEHEKSRFAGDVR
jgi:hypothetical protein